MILCPRIRKYAHTKLVKKAALICFSGAFQMRSLEKVPVLSWTVTNQSNLRWMEPPWADGNSHDRQREWKA
ncbi:unnamed protein product [Mycena citricolor]|uniref:Uncharacterized protein n=1 Tax=Mycena citricolor TaxID=2018698 RepID=A0AAD2K2F7_9AGAR|nr:unnamed protein product [Mycena citricolor]CAK5283649.1 unnamed protein product [Mycena citricolor]